MAAPVRAADPPGHHLPPRPGRRAHRRLRVPARGQPDQRPPAQPFRAGRRLRDRPRRVPARVRRGRRRVRVLRRRPGEVRADARPAAPRAGDPAGRRRGHAGHPDRVHRRHALRGGESDRGVARAPGRAQGVAGSGRGGGAAGVLRVRAAVHVHDRSDAARDRGMEVAGAAVRLHAVPGLCVRVRREPADAPIPPRPPAASAAAGTRR